jgi:hypothetical protein
MKIQEIPTELALAQTISNAEQCQKLFRYISNDRYLTRLEILQYILREAEELIKLSQSLMLLLDEQQRAQIEARNKISANAENQPQASDSQGVKDTEI